MTTFLHILLLLVDIVALAWIFDYFRSVILHDDHGWISVIICLILSICINIYMCIHGYYDLFIFFGIYLVIYFVLYMKFDLGYHVGIDFFIMIVLGVALSSLSTYLSTKGFVSDASALATVGLLLWWVFCAHLLVPLVSKVLSEKSEIVGRITLPVLQFIGLCIVVWFISDIINGQISF